MLKEIVNESDLFIVVPLCLWLPWLRLDVVTPYVRQSTVCTEQWHWKLWQRGVDCEPCHPWGRGEWCRFKLRQPGGNAITEPDSQLWIWTLVLFWNIIVSDCTSHHLQRFKLHFNYLPILDATVTELPTILHPNCRSFASKQDCIQYMVVHYHWLGFAKSSLFDFLTGTSFLSCYIWAIRSVIIHTRPTLHFFDKRKWTTADCRSWSMILTLALQRMSHCGKALKTRQDLSHFWELDMELMQFVSEYSKTWHIA